MKKLSILVLCALSFCVQARSQGFFAFDSDSAPTRLGSLDGPLAGPGIWAQALVGLTPDSLAPLGVPTEHFGYGEIHPQRVDVPFGNPDPRYQWGSVFVQLAAWDGRVWGTDFSQVPPSQLGHTDTVVVGLDFPPGGGYTCDFTQPAVVPVVPEPSVLALAALGGALLFFHRCVGSSGVRKPGGSTAMTSSCGRSNQASISTT